MTRIKKTYAALGRFSHTAVAPLLKVYMSQNHIRVRVLITNEEKEVLLVRNWLGRQRWTLPGGGIKRSETPAEAGAREVYEETGLRIPHDHLHELGVFTSDASENYTFSVACFAIEIAKREPHIARHRRLEMLDIAWFPIANLPKDISNTVIQALALKK